MSTILVVDDSPTARKAITDALSGAGHRIITATDGDEALRKALQEHPDLILLDIVMPGKNGFQVCRQLKMDTATKDIKIILVTSKDQASDRFWGLKQGADAYITKPFVEAELRASVAQCL
ncbi:MAG: PleD family two-component system response regulator [Candidatus Tectimicrobiota bacterium]